jgi:hypothetical protein
MPRADISCVHEDDVLMMVSTGRWPEGAPSELRAHAASCQVCRELGVAAAGIMEEAEQPVPALPSAGQVWWRAQLRARQEAARQVATPITAVQLIAFSAIVGVTGAVFGATTEWFQRTLASAGSMIAGIFAAVSWPKLPEDLSSIPSSYWIIVLVVGLGLVAGAAVFSWAMKEE